MREEKKNHSPIRLGHIWQDRKKSTRPGAWANIEERLTNLAAQREDGGGWFDDSPIGVDRTATTGRGVVRAIQRQVERQKDIV